MYVVIFGGVVWSTRQDVVESYESKRTPNFGVFGARDRPRKNAMGEVGEEPSTYRTVHDFSYWCVVCKVTLRPFLLVGVHPQLFYTQRDTYLFLVFATAQWVDVCGAEEVPDRSLAGF